MEGGEERQGLPSSWEQPIFPPIVSGKHLTRLIQGVETVLFEGPLDQESMARVVRYGQQGEDTPSLYEALDPAVIREINRQLGDSIGTGHHGGFLIWISSIRRLQISWKSIREGVRPWMAFFTIWSAFLNWKHSMDVEAFHIAQKLGKKIEYLETIEDQLTALDGIPFERIVNYLNHIKHWSVHKEVFTKAFLEGDMQKFFSMTGEFPTRCESIIAKARSHFL